MEQLESCGLLEKTTLISLADMSELNFLYEGRISVKLGTANDLAYKVRFVADVILDVEGTGLSASDRGTLDASHQYTDGTGYVTFQSAVSTRPRPDRTACRRRNRQRSRRNWRGRTAGGRINPYTMQKPLPAAGEFPPPRGQRSLLL